MTWLGRLTGLFLLCGWSLSCSHGTTYRFVNTLSEVEPSAARPLVAENGLLAALDTAGIEPAVRRLAAPEMEGRRQGTPGNARARAYIVSRLRHAGLAPLFQGAFECFASTLVGKVREATGGLGPLQAA